MEIDIRIVEGSIEGLPGGGAARGGAGAIVEFWGIVRPTEDGRGISALNYEAYVPMAEAEMRRILTDLCGAHPCLRARVFHRVGKVPVGEAAIYVGVAAVHRAEAFAMASGFMDQLKRDVPIWKLGALQ